MDTVQLNGKYFNIKTEDGKTVKKGDLLIEFDIDGIKSEGYEITTPVVVTNTADYLDVIPVKDSYVKHGDEIIKIVN